MLVVCALAVSAGRGKKQKHFYYKMLLIFSNANSRKRRRELESRSGLVGNLLHNRKVTVVFVQFLAEFHVFALNY